MLTQNKPQPQIEKSNYTSQKDATNTCYNADFFLFYLNLASLLFYFYSIICHVAKIILKINKLSKVILINKNLFLLLNYCLKRQPKIL